MPLESLLTTYERQLLQVFHGVVWDGNLISKHARDELERDGRLLKWRGWSIITRHGLDYILDEKLENMDAARG